MVVAFHKKDYQEKSIMSLWRQDEDFDMPFSITKKHTNPNQDSTTPHANFYRRMLSYNIIKKEAAKWKLIYFFSISLFFLKVIWYNLDSVVLKLHKKVTKNEKSFVFSKKKWRKWWTFKKMKNMKKRWTACVFDTWIRTKTSKITIWSCWKDSEIKYY